jgi:hypothetical protein
MSAVTTDDTSALFGKESKVAEVIKRRHRGIRERLIVQHTNKMRVHYPSLLLTYDERQYKGCKFSQLQRPQAQAVTVN